MSLLTLNVRKSPIGAIFRVSHAPTVRLNSVALTAIGTPRYVKVQWDPDESELVFVPAEATEEGVVERTQRGCLDIYRRGLEGALGKEIVVAEYNVRIVDNTARVKVSFLGDGEVQNG